MNVLYVHEKFGFFGGVEQNMFDTARALRGRGHKCYLTVREGTGHDEKGFREAFDRIDIGWNGESPTAVEIGMTARQYNCDTVYVHKVPDTSFASNESAWTVRMVHDHDVTCPRRHKYYLWNGQTCKQPIGACCYADLAFIQKTNKGLRLKSIEGVRKEAHRQNSFDRVLTNSRAMSESLTLNGVDPTRVRVVHPVVPEVAGEITPVPDTPNLLFVGQLIKGKGVDLLLKTLSTLKADWRLTIAGDGNMRDELEMLTGTLEISDRVEFLGRVSADVARHLYDDARIVCMPARWPEPFGMVGVEAMRRARPVVAFDVGGISDWLSQEKTGILVPEQDLAAYGAALERLLKDHDTASLYGEQARWAAIERFSFDHYITKLESLLIRGAAF